MAANLHSLCLMFNNRETRQTDSSSGKILKDVSLTLLIAKQ